jgi:hypothetical protein
VDKPAYGIVEAFQRSRCYLMFAVVQHFGNVFFQRPGEALDGFESAFHGPVQPFFEVAPGIAPVAAGPHDPERLLEHINLAQFLVEAEQYRKRIFLFVRGMRTPGPVEIVALALDESFIFF